jgi:hypothetical protein
MRIKLDNKHWVSYHYSYYDNDIYYAIIIDLEEDQ